MNRSAAATSGYGSCIKFEYFGVWVTERRWRAAAGPIPTLHPKPAWKRSTVRVHYHSAFPFKKAVLRRKK